MPENILINWGNNDTRKDVDPEKIAANIKNLSKSVSEGIGINVVISNLVPCAGYMKEKVRSVNNMLRDYCKTRILTFLKHENINAKSHCNISGLHLNRKYVPLFNENFQSLSNTLHWKIWLKEHNSKGKNL